MLLVKKIDAQDGAGGPDQISLVCRRPGRRSRYRGWRQLASRRDDDGEQRPAIEKIAISGGSNADWLVDGLRLGTTFDAVVVDNGIQLPVVSGDLNDDRAITLADWLLLRGRITLDTSALANDDRLRQGDFNASGALTWRIFESSLSCSMAPTGRTRSPRRRLCRESGSVGVLTLGGVAETWRRHRDGGR